MNKFVEKFFTVQSPKETKPSHIHNWEVIAKTYAPPRGEHDGMTNILWKCSCGEFRKEEMKGSDENTLEELATKAEKYGPQYIEYEGGIYIISKYTPPINPETLPLR